MSEKLSIQKKVQRVGYVRVSSEDQSTDRQLDGVQVDKVFVDKASGKDVQRPQLLAALEYLRDGDTLVVHSMDRLARNAEDLLRIVRELVAQGVTVTFLKNQLSFSGNNDHMAKLMLTMLAAFSEFERDLIRERQREGIAIAKAKGVYKGRKRALTPQQVAEVIQLALTGMPKAELARTYGISRETLYQYLRSGSTAAATSDALSTQSIAK